MIASSDLHRHHTRKKLVILVEQKKSLAINVKDKNRKRRYTKLKEWPVI